VSVIHKPVNCTTNKTLNKTACANGQRRLAGEGARATLHLLDLQHAIQRHPCPVLYVVLYFDLVYDIAFRQIFQYPA
jgi:hypothetical protein